MVKGRATVLSDVHPAFLLPGLYLDEGKREAIIRDFTAYLEGVAAQLAAGPVTVHTRVCFGRPAGEILALAEAVDSDVIVMSGQSRTGLGQWMFGQVTDRVLRGATCPLLLVPADHAEDVRYRRILVPLDGSEPAERILPHVRKLAHPGETHVTLLSVLPSWSNERLIPVMTSYPPGLSMPAATVEYAEVQIKNYLRHVVATLRDERLMVDFVLRRGIPVEEILTYAEYVGADLIGMTTHGLSGPSRWVYGGVTGRIVQQSPVPVLLVRPIFKQGGNSR
jgi:nucleotide-binding universal stress UspA family protein